MDITSKNIEGLIMAVDWDGVIDLKSDDRYADALGKIDYRTTRKYAEELKNEFENSEKTSEESFDDAHQRYSDKMKEHYALKDKYLLERIDSKLMTRYGNAIKEIARQIISSDLPDENYDELIDVIKEVFPREDKILIGRYVSLLLRAKKKIPAIVDDMMKNFPDESREELTKFVTELVEQNPSDFIDDDLEVFGRIPYRRIIRGISKESETEFRDLATCGKYELTLVASHCNVKLEAFLKDRLIKKLFGKYKVMFIPIPFYPTILKDGLSEREIEDLRTELKAFDIDLEQEKGPTSKHDYIRYYLYKHYNIFVDNEQLVLIDNSGRNVKDCDEKGGIGILFKLGTTNPLETDSLSFEKVNPIVEQRLENTKRK